MLCDSFFLCRCLSHRHSHIFDLIYLFDRFLWLEFGNFYYFCGSWLLKIFNLDNGNRCCNHFLLSIWFLQALIISIIFILLQKLIQCFRVCRRLTFLLASASIGSVSSLLSRCEADWRSQVIFVDAFLNSAHSHWECIWISKTDCTLLALWGPVNFGVRKLLYSQNIPWIVRILLARCNIERVSLIFQSVFLFRLHSNNSRSSQIGIKRFDACTCQLINADGQSPWNYHVEVIKLLRIFLVVASLLQSFKTLERAKLRHQKLIFEVLRSLLILLRLRIILGYSRTITSR